MTCMQYYLIKYQQGVECCILLLCEGCMMMYSDWAIVSMSCRFWPCRRCQPSRVLTLSLPPMPGNPTGLVEWGGNWKLWKHYIQQLQASFCLISFPRCHPPHLSKPALDNQVKGFQRIYDAPEADKESKIGWTRRKEFNSMISTYFSHMLNDVSMYWRDQCNGRSRFLVIGLQGCRPSRNCASWGLSGTQAVSHDFLKGYIGWCPPKSRAERWKPAWQTLQKIPASSLPNGTWVTCFTCEARQDSDLRPGLRDTWNGLGDRKLLHIVSLFWGKMLHAE